MSLKRRAKWFLVLAYPLEIGKYLLKRLLKYTMEQPYENGPFQSAQPNHVVGFTALTERYTILSGLSADLMFAFLLFSNGNLVLTWISGP